MVGEGRRLEGGRGREVEGGRKTKPIVRLISPDYRLMVLVASLLKSERSVVWLDRSVVWFDRCGLE